MSVPAEHARPADGALSRDGRALGSGGRLLSEEQTRAIDRREGPLLLVAGAGSGKTTVMVERFVRHVLVDDVPVGGILAITFTRKAAGELRVRIRERFSELGRPDLAREAQAAWISTIDGFCARVLRAHAISAGLDPDFSILDDSERRTLREQAFGAALDAWLGSPDGPPRLAPAQILAGYGHDDLARAIWQVYDQLRSAGHREPRIPVPAVPDTAAARAALLDALASARAELAAVAAPGKMVLAALANLECCAAALAHDDARPARPADWSITRHGDALKSDACDAHRAALEAYLQRLDDVDFHPVLVLLAELLASAADALEREKAACGVLDFDDLALRARDLLRAEPGVAAAYAARLQRVMVDEFQDTNRLQLDLITALGQEHVFAVGDALQSIYAFRNADVAVFLEQEHLREAAGGVERLALNYRSEPEILALVNAAFGSFQAHWSPLLPGREATADPACVELLLTDESAWKADPPDGPAEADLAALGSGLPAAAPHVAAEARLVAERVRALTDAGRPERDIVVLLRAGANLALYERALEQAGVPAVASQGRDWWAKLEVRDLLAHLRVLANPRDEEALLGALAAFAEASADTLAVIALERRGAGLWEALCRAAADAPQGALAGIPAEARERLRAYHAVLVRERDAAGRMGPGDLLRRLLEATGYEARAAARHGGARRVANVRKLVRLADAYAARGERDVRAFADFAAGELAADVPTSDAPVDVGESAAVRLMTIHAAKGLEFPVVVLADLGRRPPGGGPRILVDDRDGRVGISVLTADRRRGKAFDHAALAAEQSVRDGDEARRVVHVGVTRAEDLLILSGAAPLAKGRFAEITPGGPPLTWMGTGMLGAELGGLAEAEDELVPVPGGSGARVRLRVNRPAAVGRVLRELQPVAPASPATPVPAAPAVAVLPAGSGPAFAGSLSYSSLADHAACPFRWYLRKVLGLPERDASDLPGATGAAGAAGGWARDRGSLAHVLLEHADLAAGAQGPSADEVRERAAALGMTVDDDDVADQQRLVGAFLRSPLRERAGRARRVLREARFALPLDPAAPGGAVLAGVIDLFAEEDDGSRLIVDHKTDRVAPDHDLEAHVDERYALQRAAYALAALRAGAPVAEVVHLFLERPGEPVSVRYEAARQGELEDVLRAAAAGILSGEYPVSSVPHARLCGTCPGRGGLCSWGPEATSRQDPDTPAPA